MYSHFMKGWGRWCLVAALVVLSPALPPLPTPGFHAWAAEHVLLVEEPFAAFERQLPPSQGQFDRSRSVSVNPLIAHPGVVAPGDRLRLNLFDDVSLGADIDSVTTNSRGTVTVRARIHGLDFSHALVITTDDESLVLIDLPEQGTQYRVIYDPFSGTYQLSEIALDNLDFLVPLAVEFPEQGQDTYGFDAPSTIFAFDEPADDVTDEPPILFDQGVDDPAIIAVMVVYTPAARQWAESDGGIDNVIAASMARAQLVADNSDTGVSFVLVHSAEVDYAETGDPSSDLERLLGTNDGHMDEIHAWRDTYGADLVILFENRSDIGGLGYLLTNSGGSPGYGFSLARVQQVAWTYTQVHEMGHNMGLHHHKEQNYQPGVNGLFSYSAGWRWVSDDNGRYCSVMTYERGEFFDDGFDHTTVAHFSNPYIEYLGEPTGDVADGDNARTVREIKHVIAAYRTSTNSYDVDLSASPAEGGTTAGGGSFAHGTQVTVQATANEGYTFSDWTVDDIVVSTEAAYTFVITEDRSLVAHFSPNTYTVTATAGSGGSITPASREVYHGETTTFTVTPESGYSIESVNGCGGKLVGNTYTTGPITADCMVSATFSAIITYTVIATSGSGGYITPASRTVYPGETAAFTISPNAGYSIDTVNGCNGTLNGNTYTTGPVTGPCTVSATFSRNTYTVTASAGSGGIITPASRTVYHGETATFTLTPDTGYSIEAVTGFAGSLSEGTYTTGPITGPGTVSALFSLNTYTVTASADSGGSITPTSRVVAHGDTAMFTITPEPGYDIDTVNGCEGELDETTFTTEPITGDCSLDVTFRSTGGGSSGGMCFITSGK